MGQAMTTATLRDSKVASHYSPASVSRRQLGNVTSGEGMSVARVETDQSISPPQWLC